jgi:hypothetical protein
MIEEMGFAHYFLVVHDIVRWARAQGVACSGRGSAGNSIVCHALDITVSEPIRHNLLFERFLNPNRCEMPNIDVDFCSSRRDEVIDHIYKTFGSEHGNQRRELVPMSCGHCLGDSHSMPSDSPPINTVQSSFSTRAAMVGPVRP